MKFFIITRSGKPLVNDAGTIILFASRAEAQRWSMPGDKIIPARSDIVGAAAIKG